jgi:hypothetical protein
MHILLFAMFQLLVSGYALFRGGAPERLVALFMVVAAVATGLMSPQGPPDFTRLVRALLMIDLAFLVAVMAVALFADRYWPLWIAALQLTTLAVHGVRVYDPTLVPYAYAWTVAKAAYLMLFLLIAGVWRHEARTRSGRAEYDWTAERRRCELRESRSSRSTTG